MAKKKVYAVRKGKKTGLFYSWDECKASIDGVSGAVYKGFLTEAEAREYLDGIEGFRKQISDGNMIKSGTGTFSESSELSDVESADGKEMKKQESSEAKYIDSASETIIPESGQIIAYVDGSFEVSLARYAYGCVILTPEGEIFRESGSGNNPESAALRNVTGEMLGAMNVVKWCIEHGYQAVDIRYDYMGIEMWATGGWKAKNTLTQKYAEYMQRQAKRIQITFKKIAAHTGDKYNEEADKLAKAALEMVEE